MLAENQKVWAVAFLQSGSPGAVFRFLERRRTEIFPATLFLSDALSPAGWRALPGDRDFLLSQVASLSNPFSPGVLILYRDKDLWGWALWENGEEKKRHEAELPALSDAFESGLLARTNLWFNGNRQESPPLAWARQRGAPLNRIPGIAGGYRPVPIIDYHTVAGLDQRNLLVETRPCLYRFPMTPVATLSPRQG